jgi:hypothetical protein
MSIRAVARELLVRYLDRWTPAALHATRGATFAQLWAGPADVDMAEAALRVFAEFGDRVRGRRLTMLVLSDDDPVPLAARLQGLQRELGTPAELTVHVVEGIAKRDAALKAAGAAGAPLLTYLDGPDIVAVSAGKPSEMLVVTRPGRWAAQAGVLRDHGFGLTAAVDLINEGATTVALATGSAKSLEAFKDEVWALDEYAGVRLRDPHDPAGEPLDITAEPHLGVLKRELLGHLADGPATVTELKHFTLTATIYRAGDATRAVQALVHAGTVTRTPPGGKLGGDVVIRASGG